MSSSVTSDAATVRPTARNPPSIFRGVISARHDFLWRHDPFMDLTVIALD
jgi:hypothetical protein